MVKDKKETRSLVIEWNVVPRVLLIVLIIAVSYLVALLLLGPIFIPYGSSVPDMMGHMWGFNQQAVALNLIALSLAVVLGLLASQLLKATPSTPTTPVRQVDELKIIQKALSDDERAVIDEVRRAGKITQDSLRFRLNWSKAKVSRILTNLDKMNLIQRERVGKTYYVFLSGKEKETV